jgi:serpin B
MRTSILRTLPALALVLSPLAATGCSNSSSGGGSTSPQDYGVVQSSLSRNMSPSVAPADLQTLTTGNTAFAFDMYHAIAAGNETDNLFYSPYSVSIALAMTYAGAQSSTETQMAGALDFQLPQATLHPAFDSLDLQLASRAHGQAGDNGQPFKLNVIDSLWGDKTFTFQKPFLDTLATYYGAGLRTVDFVNAPDTARGTINSWVADQTDDLIPTLLPPQSITSDTEFVIVNAIYFNAGWETPFLAAQTHPGTFTHLDASTVQVPMMNGGLEGNYAKGTGWQAVELPYAGGQTSMVVVLPDAGQFTTVETALDGAFVGSLFSSLKDAQIAMTLPKFTVKGSTISLKTELGKLGMTDAFDPNTADFAGIASQKVWIGDVLHQAFVSVDENGTQAAAATAVIGVGTAAMSNVVTVDVNRPFFVLIRDIPTSSVLFAGRIVAP